MGRPSNEPDPGAGPLELFASKYRRYRKIAAISQADLAAEIVFTPQFVAMVEVAAGPGPAFAGIRDTKNRALGQLTIMPKTWRAFIASRHVTGI